MTTSLPPPSTTTAATSTAVPTAGARWQVPRLRRDDAWIGGVSDAIASEIGVPVGLVRAAWVPLALAGGWGIVLYLVAWGLLAWADADGWVTDRDPVPKGKDPRRRVTGFVFVVVGLTVLFAQLPGLTPAASLALVVAGAGLAVARLGFDPGSGRDLRGWRGLIAVFAGLAVAAFATMVAVVAQFGFSGSTVFVALAVSLAFVIVAATAPWWWAVACRLDQERQARVRADERAAVAAHLHDSVLQTLILIQNNDHDAPAMSRLARRQERELRNWLDPRRVSRSGQSLKGQLDELVSDVEELYDVEVATVVVGDAIIDEPIQSLLAATREAVVNAAKHAGVDTIDVFIEIGEDSIESFVRDRGVGFDVDATMCRIGIRDSIRGRVERCGGTVAIMSEPGLGTEVEMSLPRQKLP